MGDVFTVVMLSLVFVWLICRIIVLIGNFKGYR